MKVDLTQIFLIFDNFLPQSNEERAVYWFETKREDGLTVNLFFSIYEERADVTVYAKNDIIAASCRFEKCSEIRVLNEKRKCLEILHTTGNGRCFLSLLENSILEYCDDKNF